MVMLLAIALTYVFVHGSHNIISGGNASLNVMLAKRDQYGSSFLWFRRGTNEYLIRDEAILNRVDRLFDPVRASDPEAKSVRDRLRPLEKRESQLDKEIDALSDRDADEGDPPLTAAEEDRLNKLRREMDDLHARLRVLETQENDLDRKRDALEADAERRMVPVLDEAIRQGTAVRIR